MTLPIVWFNNSITEKSSNVVKPEKKLEFDKNIFVKPELKQVGDNFAVQTSICKYPKKETETLKMFDDLVSSDSMNEKMKVILETNKTGINSSYQLLAGDCKIKYRFETDIKKSTFAPVETNPKEYGKNKEFFYVNGINTKDVEAKKTATELSKLTGQNVKAIYNPTEGIGKDLLEAAVERMSDSKFDKVTRKTALNFYNTLSSGKDLKIIAHSQGAAITSDALKLCEAMLVIEKTRPILNERKDSKIGTYAESDNTKLKNTFFYTKPLDDVAKVMSRVEVITMGGAASQDKFPNIKLVEIVNPKDPVPQIAGDDLLQTSKNRKNVTIGNISYISNTQNTNTSSNFMFNKNIQHACQGLVNLGSNIGSFVSEEFAKNKNLIDYHKVDEGKDAYLNQPNVRSLIYNFGRQDFQT